ncbi:Double-stranded RNA-binding protein 3 [Zea mays]|uniref:Double-stranded RNA-binding protein 3 n=1 Tax=Zea mays TaxID=4577 RepID=A0A1D6J2G5_MAIZE|nr:Double-stranded RNA-binding protein 3 [Zea mays]AQK42233.1 Double-stranded RNA-binding protein 3 [Zea mays]
MFVNFFFPCTQIVNTYVIYVIYSVFLLDETGIYKNLLQETAHRAGLKLPIYTTIRSGPGHTPVFACTVELAGKAFTGNPGKTKKQAQKNAAMAAWSELKKLPRVGEPSSSSCPPDQDDEVQEQVVVTRTLASLNQANSGKVPHQKEKQQSNNRPSSRRCYPKPNTPFYRPFMQNQAYPSVPPDQAMYHLWHRMQVTANASLSSGLLPCFPDASPAMLRHFSPYPVSYVPRSPLPVTVHNVHERRHDHTETVELPDAVVFSQCTTLDSFRTSECGGPPLKVQEPTKNRKEGCIGSPEKELDTLAVSSSTAQASSQKLEANEGKQTVQAGLKQTHEQQLMSSSSCVSSSVVAQSSHYASSIQHDESIHRRNPPHTSSPALPDVWSSRSQALPRFGSPSWVFQQRPWLAAPVTVRTAVPVCSARPNVVNSTTGIRPAAQSHDGERDLNSAAAASSGFNKLQI